MINFLQQFDDTTMVLITLSSMLLAGFIVTRITKKLKLPNVSGFIIAGILIGPYSLNIVSANTVTNMRFVGDIALAFIAFDVGRFLQKDVFKESGKESIIVTLFESLLTGLIITLLMRYVFSFDWSFSLLLGAISTATAPASTMMTINQYKAKGKFVNTLLQVIVLDDVVCLIAFSIATAFVNASVNGGFSFTMVALPILYNVVALGIGFIFGLILSRLLTANRSRDNRLIITVGLLLLLSALCSMVDISPLLACMMFGATYINVTRDKTLYKEIHKFTPPIFSLFFIISGVNLDLKALTSLGIVGIAYFLVRILGKYLGAYLGSYVTGSDKEISTNLGLALIPQAGVAIGLAFLGQRLLPIDVGNKFMTIILASSVLYELVGPASAKFALIRAGSIPKEKKAASLNKKRSALKIS